MYNLNYAPTTSVVQSRRENISGGMQKKRISQFRGYEKRTDYNHLFQSSGRVRHRESKENKIYFA
jgi:hypothetical protein